MTAPLRHLTLSPCLDSQLYHYAIVRRDLPIGILSASLVHAAGESSNKVPPGTNAVVLAVADEVALRALADRLGAAGIRHVLIRESDPPYADQAMAIGVEPVEDRRQIRRLVSSLPLLK